MNSTRTVATVGLFGGTFDPVHFGHLRAALEARDKLGVEDFRLLPAGRPAHRDQPGASPQHRLEMLKLAVSRASGLQVDDREVRRPGPSYMVDTLAEIRSEAGDAAPLLLFVGQDAANHLDRWHRWRRLLELAHLVVMRRPEAHFASRGELEQEIRRRRVHEAPALRERPAGLVLALEVTQLDISSTRIRALFAADKSPRFLLPESVIDYIHRHALYGSV